MENEPQALEQPPSRLPAWSPQRSSLASDLSRHTAPELHRPDDDGAPPTAAAGPPAAPDDVEIALLGDAAFVPPQRPYGAPPSPDPRDEAPVDPAWAATVDAVRSDHAGAMRAPHDPGAWAATHHLGPWIRAIQARLTNDTWPDVLRRQPLAQPTTRPTRHNVNRLARAQLLLLGAPSTDTARDALLETLGKRLDAIELSLARAGQRVPQSTAYLQDLAGIPAAVAQRPPDPGAWAWWQQTLAVPSASGWQAPAPTRLPAAQPIPGRPTPDASTALRQAIAWRGVDLYRANLRLRARVAATVRAMAELEGPATGAALLPLAQAVDHAGQRLTQALRALGQALNATQALEPSLAMERLTDLAHDHDAARRHVISVLTRQVGAPSPARVASLPDDQMGAAWSALHGDTASLADTLSAVAGRTDGLAVAAWWARADRDGAHRQDGLALLRACLERGAHGAAALHAAALMELVERPVA